MENNRDIYCQVDGSAMEHTVGAAKWPLQKNKLKLQVAKLV